jgi:hypothetical protein
MPAKPLPLQTPPWDLLSATVRGILTEWGNSKRKGINHEPTRTEGKFFFPAMNSIFCGSIPR